MENHSDIRLCKAAGGSKQGSRRFLDRSAECGNKVKVPGNPLAGILSLRANNATHRKVIQICEIGNSGTGGARLSAPVLVPLIPGENE
jgi:hypothetical protein